MNISFEKRQYFYNFVPLSDKGAYTIIRRTKFLYSRENYSYQLRDHLTAQGAKNPTCITCFALKRKDIDKKYARLRKKYANGKFLIKEVKQPGFRYQAIKPDE